jgi:hypothetical protein
MLKDHAMSRMFQAMFASLCTHVTESDVDESRLSSPRKASPVKSDCEYVAMGVKISEVESTLTNHSVLPS